MFFLADLLQLYFLHWENWLLVFTWAKVILTTLYGAAGSIIIIMVWVYYSSIILYFGAEFTKVHANLYGRKIQPNEYAEWIMTEEKQVARSST